MNRQLFLALVGLILSSHVLADSLDDEIKQWRPGAEIPHALLSYPSGKFAEPGASAPICSFSVDSVWPHIASIEDDRLLEELVFDKRSELTTFTYATNRLIERAGLPKFAAILETRPATRWELQWLRQMLRAPSARISVAFIEKDLMPVAAANAALDKLKHRLDSGQPWLEAYRAIADENPDAKQTREEGMPITLVSYLFGGWVSEIGFSYSNLQVTPYVPATFFEQSIAAGKGGHVYSDESGTYLVYVFEQFRQITADASRIRHQLAPDRVLSLATEAFERCTKNSSAYERSELQFLDATNVWSVYFKERGDISPHGGKAILVNDRSQKVCVVPGTAPATGQCE